MFPYPSGAGLHMGHAYNYCVVDSYCRWLRFKGERVFQPFGYDAFGLPAELYAAKVGRDPKEVTEENIGNFRKQMVHMNTGFQEILTTCDPSYYKWTQWIFQEMAQMNLAYRDTKILPYDTQAKTFLANEQVADGISKLTNTKVEERETRQYFLRITDYKDRLINNLKDLDYPESTKKQQLHWLEKLEDWCVSRQRSWGTPIPEIYRTSDTLDTFLDSSFYFLRYLDPNNDKELVAKNKARPVDIYVGGSEHACMHLIYARFVTMFLHDIGVIDFEEPFKKVIHQGMITKDGNKMSKSLGNVVNPDDFDSDELRLYLMMLGPYDRGGDWSDSGVKGPRRFIKKLNVWLSRPDGVTRDDFYELINQIDDDIKRLKFNTVISKFMTYYNTNKHLDFDAASKQKFVDMFSVFAPGFKVG